jgi:RimJ/RimL family protein N-acetyltransferase
MTIHVPDRPVRVAGLGVVLRGNTTADAAAATALFADPDTAQWYSGPDPRDAEGIRRWCLSSADWSSGGHATWAIADQHDAMIGNLSLVRIDTHDMSAVIAYRLIPSARGHGVATAAVRLATGWAFETLGLERIELIHAVDNPASCRVAERAGYLLEGIQRAGYRDDQGRRWDAHLHARLSTDPEKPDGSPQPV